ncbi:hypothetical protein [Adhaeribacter aquaticus]|uniref:hypothetical protein n=1 Tax=Adhaeribacter aquaticus TaxID=299567 RepID=UPI0004229181|nr:hypothetical protein [Adhaeribacter aquaticus]
MNKSAFLDVLHHVSSISEQEVVELEKLVSSFPYCQTAHLLLAKAAYDQGSMLSNQRIRRAAACATNRQLLKRLINTADTNLVLEPIATPEPILTTEPEEVSMPTTIELVEAFSQNSDIAEVPTEVVLLNEEPTSELPVNEELPKLLVNEEPASTESEELNQEVQEPIQELQEPESVPANILTDNSAFEDEDSLFVVEHLAAAAPLQESVTDFISTLTINSGGELELIKAEEDTVEPVSEIAVVAPTQPETVLPPLPVPLDAEVEIPTEPVTLPSSTEGLIPTPVAEETLVLEQPKQEAYKEEIIYKVFDSNDLGYWMDSSRLGESLSVKNDLTTIRPYSFHPELLLEYSKHHEMEIYEPQPESILTSQLDIIDQFLKLNPKIKSMNNMRIKQEVQEDLSSKSTRIKKPMASETLANIMAQQGKYKKAIKIYEQLILRIPEKKPYFASQIEKLQKLT